jgi:arabinofuranosyltransferase
MRRSAAGTTAWAFATLAALVATSAVCALRAWVADDAFITYRVLDNWVAGFGLRWNIVDRVQVSTHPAWLLLQAPTYALTRDPATTMLVSAWGCLIVAGASLARASRPSPAAWLALGVAPVLAHRRLTEFLWSGLEVPLTLLCMVGLALVGVRAVADTSRSDRTLAPLWLGVVVAILFLTRPDAVLIAAPLCAVVLLRRFRGARAAGMAVGVVPALAWCGFAWWYFGDPLPNTASAKLGVAWPALERLGWGGRYVLDALRRDPAFGLVAAAAVVGSWRALHSPQAYVGLSLVLGGALHVAWVVIAGGDFMSGRFLLPAYLACWAALWVTTAPSSHGSTLARFAPALLVLQLASRWLAATEPPARTEAFWAYASRAPVDERAYYAPAFGVFRAGRGGHAAEDPGVLLNQPIIDARAIPAATERPFVRVVPAHAVGWYGYASGPETHIVDAYGLVDPVIARQPGVPEVARRPGHIERVLPDGYLSYLATGDASHLAASERDAIVALRRRVEGPAAEGSASRR